MDAIQFIQQQNFPKVANPEFKAGDTVNIHYKIKEGDKERIQQFSGVVIQIKGHGASRTFTVRKISNGVGVERIFPFNSPYVDKVEVNKRGDVRRARLFYLRNLTGKKARIQERKLLGETETPAAETATV